MRAFHTGVSWISRYREYGHEIIELYIIYGFFFIIKHMENSSYKSDIQLFPKWKPNTWKLAIQEHGNASLSYMDFWYLELQSICKEEWKYIHHITNLGHQISSAKCKHCYNKCIINMRVWENGEEGMRE